jgi:hypothetical protein
VKRFFCCCFSSGLQKPTAAAEDNSSLYCRGQAHSQPHNHCHTQEEGGGEPQQIQGKNIFVCIDLVSLCTNQTNTVMWWCWLTFQNDNHIKVCDNACYLLTLIAMTVESQKTIFSEITMYVPSVSFHFFTILTACWLWFWYVLPKSNYLIHKQCTVNLLKR